MAIVPDDKNWTWVLDRVCPDCGFDAASVDRARVGELVRDEAARWPAWLVRPDATVRPSPDRWSALEYGCHVRDVFRLFDERLALMMSAERVAFANWDQDATAIAERYDEQDPLVVADELIAAADANAERWERVTDWDRVAERSDGSVFTLDAFARYFLHDPVHHAVDVADGYRRLEQAGRPGADG